FRLERKDGPGLSIVIPFPDLAITPKETAKAFIRHYFAPLTRGTLSVVVETPGEKIRLSRETLREVTGEQFSDRETENLLKTFDLVEWSQKVPASKVVTPDMLPSNKAPVWDLVKFSDENRVALTQQYEDKQRLAVRISLWVKEKGKQPQPG